MKNLLRRMKNTHKKRFLISVLIKPAVFHCRRLCSLKEEEDVETANHLKKKAVESYKNGNLDKAKEYLLKAIELHDTTAMNNYGWILFKQGLIEEATKYFVMASEHGDTTVMCKYAIILGKFQKIQKKKNLIKKKQRKSKKQRICQKDSTKGLGKRKFQRHVFLCRDTRNRRENRGSQKILYESH